MCFFFLRGAASPSQGGETKGFDARTTRRLLEILEQKLHFRAIAEEFARHLL